MPEIDSQVFPYLPCRRPNQSKISRRRALNKKQLNFGLPVLKMKVGVILRKAQQKIPSL